MEVRIRRDAAGVTTEAFDIVSAALARRPGLVVGLATGRTPLELYKRMRKLDWSRAKFFNLDEYVGLGPEHAKSFHKYLHTHLLGGLKIGQAWLFRGDSPDLEAEGASIESAVKSLGGIDLQILGIGRDGHIGYNEPGSSFGSRTRIKTLSKETLKTAGDVPMHAITMGIGTILEARQILLLATGKEKAAAVRDAIEGPVSASCPASSLQMHANAVFVIDEAAASKLKRRKYYEYVDANKWRLAES